MIDSVLGKQVILDLYDCNPDMLKKADVVEAILRKAAKVGECNVVASHFHQFEPDGVSGALFLSESHLSVHSWTSEKYAAIDIFYCSDIKEQDMIHCLATEFGASNFKIHILIRE